MKFIGIDLHSNKFTVGIWHLGDGMEKIILRTFYITKAAMDLFFKLLDKETYVVIEASTNAFWFHDQIVKKVKECFVCTKNGKRSNKNKSDKIDAKDLTTQLALYVMTGRNNKEILNPVYVPEKEVQKLRSLFSSKKILSKQKNQTKNRMHSIFKQNGICVTKKFLIDKTFITEMTKMKIDDIWKIQLKIFHDELGSIEEAIDKMEKLILLKGEDHFSNEIKILTTIRGISNLIAIAIMTEIGTVDRFRTAKKFCSYLRSAPRVVGSNENVKIKSTNKSSRATVVSLLTQSVLHLQEAGPYISKFNNRLRRGKKCGTVRMAVIRKTLVAVYNMLKKNQKYYWTEESLVNKKKMDLIRELKKAKSFYFECLKNIAA